MKIARYPNTGTNAHLENLTIGDRKTLESSGYHVTGSHGDFSIYIPQDPILAWVLCSKLQTLGFQLTTGTI